MYRSPQVMGILNVTPDSFSDGGRYTNTKAALDQARRMIDEGADIIDIGGESTRPGAAKVSLQEELDRVVPLIKALKADNPDIFISIDTSKTEVMRQAVKAGASMINDVNALLADGAIELASQLSVPICLMHKQGSPGDMQNDPTYTDVFEDVSRFLLERVTCCLAAGIDRDQILLDPGFGFGKTTKHNYNLLRKLTELRELGFPLLVGVSRKTMIGDILDNAVEQRMLASVILAAYAAENGASILRVHDVKETRQAIKLLKAINS